MKNWVILSSLSLVSIVLFGCGDGRGDHVDAAAGGEAGRSAHAGSGGEVSGRGGATASGTAVTVGTGAGGTGAVGTGAGGTGAGGTGAGGTGAVGTGAGGTGAGGTVATGGTTTTGEVFCETLAPLAAGTCSVVAGDDSKLILGDVLGFDQIYRGGQILVDAQGLITCVGCDCATQTTTATTITCPKGIISPGLINTHDHAGSSPAGPLVDTGERYEHRHEWRLGSNGHTQLSIASGATGAEISWSELRHLMSGTTSTIASGSFAAGIIRNLDVPNHALGLDEPAPLVASYPLGDVSGTTLVSSCAYPNVVAESSLVDVDAYLPTVAEGIDAAAHNEFACLSSANWGHNAVLNQSAFVGAVGLVAVDYAAMAEAGTALVWTPRSNLALYGDTAVVTAAARMGGLVTLATDWLATGSMNLLRELKCADELNAGHLGDYFSERQLWMMVTINAASAIAMDDTIGSLTTGKVADIAIFDGSTKHDYRAIIDAMPEDVALVLRGGKAMYGDAAVVAAIPNSGVCDTLDVCDNSKRLCLFDEIGMTLGQLETAASAYPAFFCDTPPNEPACVPARSSSVSGSTVYSGSITATDQDGDAILDSSDNCPFVFNPIRPMDNSEQADADGDGRGDACDVCPLVADSETCVVHDPFDSDGDGIPNRTDNCVSVANADQMDGDGDLKGDACDSCPSYANSGSVPCVVTIYDVKNNTLPVGTRVALDNALVTGVTDDGFFLQVSPNDAEYAGSDYSGIFVDIGTNVVTVGDRIDIDSATIADYYGQTQLTSATITIVSSLGESSPEPVLVSPGEVTTGGSRANALESVIVQVQDVTVTDVAPATPTNEFVVDSLLTVDEHLYQLASLPPVGHSFVTLTGILEFSYAESKLEPRSAADFVNGSAELISFGPAMSYAILGQSAVTYPEPLTVEVWGPMETDIYVALDSADPSNLGVGAGLTIPAGETTAQVSVTGFFETADTTVSATLDGETLTAQVRVISDATTRVLSSLAPAPANLITGASAPFTVTIDAPAPPGGTTVALGLDNAVGTLPASVTIPTGQFSATFVFQAGSSVGTAQLTAALGASSLSATISVIESALVINEVNYDDVGTDTAEFVEIYNGTAGSIDLTGLVLLFINGGTNEVYSSIDLSQAGATLSAGQYLVVSTGTLAVAADALVLQVLTDNSIQNGSPDGIALVDTSTYEVLDALSYEGQITSANLTAIGTVSSLVEGTPTSEADSGTVGGSLARIPNGTDTNNAAADWLFSATTSPGAANGT